MLYELESAAVVDECVACDAGCGVVGFGESSVDDHESSVGLDGVFALGCMYGYVSVDDVSVVALDFKGVEYVVADVLVVAELEVVAFSSMWVSLLVRKYRSKVAILDLSKSGESGPHHR